MRRRELVALLFTSCLTVQFAVVQVLYWLGARNGVVTIQANLHHEWLVEIGALIGVAVFGIWAIAVAMRAKVESR